MNRVIAGLLASASALAAGLPAQAEMSFNRIASFAVPGNLPADADPATATSSEIIDATADGMVLIYSDSPLGAVGLIDISDATAPKPLGSVAMGGEPTSVSVLGQTAFVGVNTSESFTNPSGRLATLDIPSKTETASCELGGQPDSVKVAKDGSFVAVAIENERDEEVNDGALPQLPAGFVAILPLAGGVVDCAGLIKADLTGIADIAPTDPEPEFVDINANGEIAVTLQENNHVAILDRTGKILGHFSAGTVDLAGIDTEDDGAISFTGTATGVPREPDAVKWIGTDHLAIANEGDWRGGSRGFSILNRDGTVAYDSGTTLEQAIAAIGHYPEGRSDAKGVEPEGLEMARFGDTDMLFVLSERGSIAAVYTLDGATPTLRQLLPSGISPEGSVAIPSRNLFVTANEADLGEDGGARSHVMIYERQDAPAAYPSITSEGTNPLIGWGALSGLAATEVPGQLVAISDNAYSAQPTIFAIDATQTPARITSALRVTRAGAPAEKMDMEGITLDGQGGYWVANEGDAEKEIPHALDRVDSTGAIIEEVAFPEALLAGQKRFGAEGVTRVGDTLWIAMQREWEDDPKGMVKLLAYNTVTKDWTAVHYPLDAAPEGGWVGLSEITAQGDDLYIVERDNQIGANAKIKRLTRVSLDGIKPAPLGGALPVVEKVTVRDFIPDLAAGNGYVVDKLEGFTIDANGNAFAMTDNDGVDDSSGETRFMPLGALTGL